MGKIAFVFSGQGDQYTGMGKELAAEYPAAKAVFDLCDSVRPETSSQCFAGTEAELQVTKNTQPCLFATELAAAAVLLEKGIRPQAVAGFSLGEVTACTAAGLFDYKTGFRLVCKRGELMQDAAEQVDASMAAVLKLSAEQVKKLCAEHEEVYPVNFNCPGQITVAGLASQMDAFASAVKAAGGRAVPLKVKGGFHSPFMKRASAAFARVLSEVSFSKPNAELYSNLTALPYTADARALLAQQICNPVQFEIMIRNMTDAGVDTFIEIGPGKTLTNMIARIDPTVNRYCTAELQILLSEVAPC